ncbi:MAG: DNA repair protein RadA [Ardenticatenaceae bacterium]|nr:DNA repair protein RadA [Ardenticatenaceae bacterium]
MAKTRTVYTCQECGAEHLKWGGRCTECGEWNTLVETVVRQPASTSSTRATARGTLVAGGNPPQRLTEIQADRHQRYVLPMGEFNRVLGGGIVPGSLVLIGGDPGIGKCVTGDTRVLDPLTGGYLPITAWAEGPRPVLAVDERSLRLAPATGAAFHERGTYPIVELRTALGRVLRCTPDHPLLTPEGWLPAGELASGSQVAAPLALPHFGCEALPEPAVKLVAYILSDGSAQSQIGLTSHLPEAARDLEEIAAAFGMQLVCYDRPRTRARQYRFANDVEQHAPARQEVASALRAVPARPGISWASQAHRADASHDLLNVCQGTPVPREAALQQLPPAAGGPWPAPAPGAYDRAEAQTPIARFLEELGVRFPTAADKAVPNRIFRLPREQLALFLNVLFTCDGLLYIDRSGRPGLSYSTISRRLAADVQHLLLRFGLVATLRTKHSRVKDWVCTAYEVVLLGTSDVQAFLATIGIMDQDEARRHVAAMTGPHGRSMRPGTLAPGEAFWELLRDAGGSASVREISRCSDIAIQNRRRERPLCHTTVARGAAALPDPHHRARAHGDVYWDEVVSVTPAGEAPVYDLTVPGKANFVANDLIIHNSTLLLQVAGMLAEAAGPVLYVSGEESAHQIKMRAERLGIHAADLFLLSETNLDMILEHLNTLRPKTAIVDSIQTVYLDELHSSAGSVGQVRECAARLLHYSKNEDVPVFIVGHVTKQGAIAGPRVLEHIVDTVLYLEGDRFHAFRLLRGQKNRFGSTNEVGVFEMVEGGLAEVENPSEAFLAEHAAGATGSAVAVTLEGTRPLLVEIQSLSTMSALVQPRRTANGIDLNRLYLLLAVLGKRVGLQLHNQDVFINVVGGLKISEPAADLAVATAIASSFRERPIARDLALIGEIGLGGELRTVSQLERRLTEAGKLGFKRVIIPKAGRRPLQVEGLQTIAVKTLVEALHIALTTAPSPGSLEAERPASDLPAETPRIDGNELDLTMDEKDEDAWLDEDEVIDELD